MRACLRPLEPAPCALHRPLDRRLGLFEIAGFLVDARAPEVTRVMSACAILRCWYFERLAVYGYCASSRYFRVVLVGELIPCYEWLFEANGGLRAIELDGADALRHYAHA
jgi:hypothetical protein